MRHAMTDTSDVQKHYQKMLGREGDHEKVGYGSVASQQLRFRVLESLALETFGLIHLNGTSVHDVGCGRGDLLEFLQPTDYVGSDATEESLEYAREKFETPNTRFVCGDFKDMVLPPVDLVWVSGSFAFYNQAEVPRFVERLLGSARVGIVFNLLTKSLGGSGHEGVTVNDPAYVFEWARGLGRASFRCDYLPHDMSVAISKKPW